MELHITLDTKQIQNILFANSMMHSQESDTTAEAQKIVVSGTIASDDVHTITDAGFDATQQVTSHLRCHSIQRWGY